MVFSSTPKCDPLVFDALSKLLPGTTESNDCLKEQLNFISRIEIIE